MVELRYNSVDNDKYYTVWIYLNAPKCHVNIV